MKRGIDVSLFQRSIDWAAVRASGIAFAMIKATQGRSERNAQVCLFTDPYFTENIAGAAANGLKIGVYHYLTAATPLYKPVKIPTIKITVPHYDFSYAVEQYLKDHPVT